MDSTIEKPMLRRTEETKNIDPTDNNANPIKICK